jgi:NADPH:quinone reductase-like Zn-dependent oxidoreductase
MNPVKLRYKIANSVLLCFALAIAALAILLGHTSACEPYPALADGEEPMQAIVYTCYGSPDVLELANVEKPDPADNEVLVKIRAASVNPLDWHYLRGSPYLMRLDAGLGKPATTRLGVDFAGVVEAVGKDVTRFTPGDEVFGGRTGAFAEYVTVREDRAIASKPANATFEEAAALPIAAVTALQALRDAGQLQSGQKVLINGASGGVGTYAVQIAKVLGAEVTGVCSTRNLQLVSSLGADHVIDYTQADYTESGQQYDLIIDNVGNKSLAANRRVLAANGRLIIVGGPQGDWVRPLIRPLSAAIVSPFVDQDLGMMLARLDQGDLEYLAGLVDQGEVRSVIDRRYALNEVADAIRYSEQGHARGKIVISLD